jgi:hypothetical protein
MERGGLDDHEDVLNPKAHQMGIIALNGQGKGWRNLQFSCVALACNEIYHDLALQINPAPCDFWKSFFKTNKS